MDTDLRDRFRFFCSHGGGIVGRRAAGALDLARAEVRLEDEGRLTVVVEPEPAPFDHGPVVPPVGDPGHHEYASWRAWWEARVEDGRFEVVTVALEDASGNTVASLGAVDGPPDAPYRRVVVAELAAEVYAS